MSGKITSLDVATRAGVSQSAVSRVFSGASASKATVEKVRKAAAELGYRPNVLARSLITGRSRIIGLAVAYMENQFYPDVLERLSLKLQQMGYHILILPAGPGRAEGAIAQMIDHQVDGIITASVTLSDDLTARCEALGLPVVLFNRGQEDARLAQVTSANLAGGRRIAEFLVAGGHRRIGHVAGLSDTSTGRDRAEGFRQGLDAAGMAPVAVLEGRFERAAAADAAEALVRRHRCDAIFVGNDHMAFAVIDRLRHELGVDVPGEVSIVGYDDVPMAAWAGYDLTTLRQPVGRMVDAAIAQLMAQLDGEARPEKIEIEGPLILRGSARCPDRGEQDSGKEKEPDARL